MQSWPFLFLPDLCRTSYAQASFRIRDAQDRARLLAIQDEVCLLEQEPDFGARAVPRHRMAGVAKPHFSMLDRHTGGAQAAGEGMSKIVDMHALQSLFATRPAATPCCS